MNTPKRPWAASDSPRKPSPRRFPEDMTQAQTARHRVALLDGLAACAMAAPASAELATEQLLTLAELAQAPGCLDFRQELSAPGLLIAAAARTWRNVNAAELGALLSAYNSAGYLESRLLEELAAVATMDGDSVGDLLEALAGLAAGWLYEAQDPERLGGNRCAMAGPYSERDLELLAFRFAESFPLELQRERALQEWNEGPLERCPYCGGAATIRARLAASSLPWCLTCDEPIRPRG